MLTTMKRRNQKIIPIMHKSDFQRQSHMASTPRAVRSPKHNTRSNMKYEQYIAISDDSDHGQEVSNNKKCYIQEEGLGINKKRVAEMKTIKVIPEEPQKDQPKELQKNQPIESQKEQQERVIECYIDQNYNNNPIIVDTEAKKEAAPIKKINFIEKSDDNDHRQEFSNNKKCYIQEEDLGIKKKRVVEMKPIRVIPKEPQKDQPERVIECYIEQNYNNNPVIVDTGAKKETAPIKKLDFIIPSDGKPGLEHERMDWNDYHQLEVIYKFMDDLESDFPSLCTTGVIGTSVEGRNLKILKISNSNASNASVWVDAGIHAREWIAPAVNTYLANHITKNFDLLPESIKNKDWYFLPVVNPDGYNYSHTVDRMWRKNRSWHGNHCLGVDLNRNFSVGWGGRGSSDKPTNAFFRGPQPFSEPETSAMRDVLLNSGIKFKVYITLHSYGQIIIFPYACRSELAPDYVRLLEGATAMSKAIYDTNGNTYKVGISRDVMYGAAGTSNDFAHGAAGIPYCYLIELRSKKHKFKLPKEQIAETCNEILNCVKALMEFVDNYTYKRRTEDSEQQIDSDVKQTDSFLAKTDSLIKKNNSSVHRNDSYIHKENSHTKKRESYDKRSYSYVKMSDSSIKRSDSYVRWSNSPAKRNDSFENTGKIYMKGTGSIENSGDSSINGTDSFVKINDSSETLIDSYEKKNAAFVKMCNLFLKSTDDLLETKDISVKRTDSYVTRDDFFKNSSNAVINRTDSFLKTNDSFMKRTDCFKDASDSFLKRNDSFIKRTDPYGKKNNLFEKTNETSVQTDFKKG